MRPRNLKGPKYFNEKMYFELLTVKYIDRSTNASQSIFCGDGDRDMWRHFQNIVI